MSTAAFGEEAAVSAVGIVRLPEDVPVHKAAIVGCAVLTGVGAVVNSARAPDLMLYSREFVEWVPAAQDPNLVTDTIANDVTHG